MIGNGKQSGAKVLSAEDAAVGQGLLQEWDQVKGIEF